jgi:hypothetical protein
MSSPTEIGAARSYALSLYGKTVSPDDLRSLPQEAWDRMHSAARKDWEREEARRIIDINNWEASR